MTLILYHDTGEDYTDDVKRNVKVFSGFLAYSVFYDKNKWKGVPSEWGGDEESPSLMKRTFQFWTTKKKFSCLEKHETFDEPYKVFWNRWVQYNQGSVLTLKC